MTLIKNVLLAGVVLTAGALVACNKDKFIDVTDPDILNVDDYNTPAGAVPLRLPLVVAAC